VCVLQGPCAAAAASDQAAGAEADSQQYVRLPGLQQQQVGHGVRGDGDAEHVHEAYMYAYVCGGGSGVAWAGGGSL